MDFNSNNITSIMCYDFLLLAAFDWPLCLVMTSAFGGWRWLMIFHDQFAIPDWSAGSQWLFCLEAGSLAGIANPNSLLCIYLRRTISKTGLSDRAWLEDTLYMTTPLMESNEKHRSPCLNKYCSLATNRSKKSIYVPYTHYYCNHPWPPSTIIKNH